MSTPKADLHLHTVFSDGFIFPDELAKKISGLEAITQAEVLEYSGLMPAIDFLIKHREKDRIKDIKAKADRSVEVAKGINTVAVLDHNTLLGAEEFISAMKKYAPGRRVVVGVEMTAIADFPTTGIYAVHMPVYFHDEKGFDLMTRNRDARRSFFRKIADDYLPIINRAAKANNHRFVTEMRKRCNDHFFDGEERVMEKELMELAGSRVEALISPDSVINLENSTMTVFHTDIADYLSLTGIEGTGAGITQKYFSREGPLYTPLRENEFTSRIEELAEELTVVSGRSEVKVRKGIAHPSTYVRVIARNILKDSGKEPLDFYNSRAEETAQRHVFGLIRDLAEKGIIDFIESDYPRYYLRPPSPDNPKAFSAYMKFIEDEHDFVMRQTSFWKEAALSLLLKTSGGSDAHFRRGTPNLGYGFCDLDFDDSRVDEIFS